MNQDHNQAAERAALIEYLMLNFSIGHDEADFHARNMPGSRRSPAVGEDGLPPLPAPGIAAYAIVGKDGAFTAEQVRQAQRDAVAADRRARQSQGEPVLYQRRMRPTWERDGKGWTMWEECTKEAHDDCLRVPVLHDWQHEARALYAAPPLSSEQQAEGEGACGS